MTFDKRFRQALGTVALGVLVSTTAIGQVTTRLVTAGGAATSTTIAPGGTVSIDVRIDAPATPTIGTVFRLSQTAPVANGFFSITARSFVGSPYNDAASGTADAVVLAPASALLDPDNNDNLGRATIGLVATPGANNILAANLTLTASAATPPGTYTIKPTAGVSFVTGDGPTFTDYDMSGATYTIIVGQAVGPPTIGKSFGAASIPLNGSTSLSFTINNPNASSTLTGVGFTDALPAGLVVSTPNGRTGSCGGGTITAVAGSSSVSLTGATLAASASCTFSANVTGSTLGTKNNTTSTVTSVEGGTGGTASASVTVAAVGPPTIGKSFGAASIALNGSTSLSFTINNPNASSTLTGVGFTDALPAGLVISTPNGLTGSCGGGTITAAAGSSSVSLTGATLAASGSCTFSVNVTASTLGTKNNTTSTVTSVEGGTGGTASASVTVAAVGPPTPTNIPTLQQWAVWLLGLLIMIVTAGVTFRQRRRD